ncbi:MAG: hypothetical protein JJV91_00290 [Desulfosarcina sp.]|nr:hypothetical protein [Desulfobacterales bacterium]
MKNVIALIIVSLLISGCAHRIGDFTVASTKNMNIKSALHKVDFDKRLVGKDVKHIIFFFPTGIPNMKEAMDNAIEKEPGAVGLSNVTVKLVNWYIPLFYGQNCYEIEGNPVFEDDVKIN